MPAECRPWVSGAVSQLCVLLCVLLVGLTAPPREGQTAKFNRPNLLLIINEVCQLPRDGGDSIHALFVLVAVL